ncbi:MAG TPA: hypothetical protein VK116_12800, partial [Planctomycetota bacterium]|nr:hypothetical protein [Planctomycetota bacterium]
VPPARVRSDDEGADEEESGADDEEELHGLSLLKRAPRIEQGFESTSNRGYRRLSSTSAGDRARGSRGHGLSLHHRAE